MARRDHDDPEREPLQSYARGQQFSAQVRADFVQKCSQAVKKNRIELG